MLLHCVPVPAHLRGSGWETAVALVELLLRNGDFLHVGGGRGRMLEFGFGVFCRFWVFFTKSYFIIYDQMVWDFSCIG